MGFEELLGVNPWTAAFTLANTITLYLVGKKFLFQPIMKMIKSRQQEIDTQFSSAQQANAQAQELCRAYEEKLAVATPTGEKLVQEAVARGHDREEEILRQARKQADSMLEKAAEDIAQQKKKALNEAKDEITVIAMDIAGKVVGRAMDEEDQARLIDGFIADLGE